ncbi:MAG: hypothetical protein E7399_07210, partial [Ruminococcaceae bacterium]|nr:hypothetical protein [Oscillospiraceae bacterium]
VLQLKPKHVVMLIGTNDILAVSPDYWWRKPGRAREEIMTEAKENLELLVKKCEGIPLTLCSVLPISICQPHDRTLINGMVLELNEHIRNLSEKYGTQYADYHSAMCDADGMLMREGLTYDGIHPNGDGYVIMANVLKQFSQFE